LSEAIVDYSSIAYCGWTWPGEARLAVVLNESDRNIRKRVARLRTAKLLIVISPSNGWRSNRYIPVLDSRPLFEVALTSEQVRDAVASLLHRDGCDAGAPVPPQDTTESGTPVPPEEANVVHVGRNARSAEPSRNNPQEGDSPTPYPAPTAARAAPQGEEGTLDQELQRASSTAPPEAAPTASSTTESSEKPTPPDGCSTNDKPEVRVPPDAAEQATASVVELSFTRLMRDYPHLPGGVDFPAYVPLARGVWGKLTTEQKQHAVRAARSAPGKEWVGHWLNNGRETGKFEIVEERAAVSRVWVHEDSPQWVAWVQAKGRRPPTTQHRIDGELQTGWFFESEWPPSLENVERMGGMK
jgi:hypothetical protein